MTDTLCQRWRERRADYRPAGEPIATAEYEVASIAQDAIAKAFVVQHHYSATYPAARYRYGLYRHAELVGVAVFSHPCSDAVLTSVFPGETKASVELGRFVLLDDVPSNGETWFLARCFAQLRQTGLRGVVSFSDPVPRRASTGALVMPGHVGTIYQAANAVYLGRATPRSLRLFADGTVFSDRAAQKIRRQERGWRYAVDQLVAAGAPPPEGDLTVWLRNCALPVTTTIRRHRGNHKYAWALHRGTRRALPSSHPYPKQRDLEGSPCSEKCGAVALESSS